MINFERMRGKGQKKFWCAVVLLCFVTGFVGWAWTEIEKYRRMTKRKVVRDFSIIFFQKVRSEIFFSVHL